MRKELETRALGDYLEFQRGISWESSQERPGPGGKILPVLTIPNVQRELNTSHLTFVEVRHPKNIERKLVRRGSILMVGSNGNPARIGNSVFIDQDDRFLFASFLVGARVRERANADSKFLFHYISSPATQDEITRSVRGSTGLQNLSQRFLEGLAVPVFQLFEQKRIAEILDTLDEAIRKTEQIIAKLKQVKQGLLHDLLTRGIDDNGELRDPLRHPEQFFGTQLGLLPIGWSVSPLVDCLVGTPSNGIYKPSSAIGRGSLLVGQTSITEERSVDFVLARRAVLTRSELTRYSLGAGDILISRVFATVDGVGQPALVPAPPEPSVYESNMMRLRVNREVIHPDILFRWLRSDPVRRLVGGRVNASNQTSINQRELNSLPIGVPPLAEQQRIAHVLSEADRAVEREAHVLWKHRLFKQGLMEDLLTGRVRVTSHLNPDVDVEQAVADAVLSL